MPYLVGVVLALFVALSARRVGFDRDRAFYPAVLIVVASYYPLFAAMSDSGLILFLETLVTAAFVVAAVVGFRWSMWLVVVGLAGHGVFDAVHGHFLQNSGVPSWWPAFCLAFDVVAAGVLAWFLRSRPASPARLEAEAG